ncbi:MAG: ribulose-bisphosphate carboxylase large chain, partial [Candidatus Diapherotrites archaeon]|nr:ribulose-bisphosphate carboxylase large chain [Candidatus Diapherotrites archaeon]
VGQDFCKFEDRLYKVMEKKDLAEEETGEKKGYMVNISAPWDEMIRRAELVEDTGNEYVMIDVVIVGFSAVQAFRNYGFEFIIHAHRAMHGAITRNKKHGISMAALARIYRMLGVDQLHVGTVVGKMVEGKEEVLANVRAVRDPFFHIKPTFPVASGGLHPGLVPDIVEIFGNDVIIQAGGGVHGHPDGTEAGAAAMRQAAEAVMEGVTLEEYAKDHKELARALEKWGRARTR